VSDDIGLRAHVSKYNPNLRRARRLGGESQRAFCRRIDMSYIYYNSIECLRYWPRLVVRKRIAEGLGISLDEAFPEGLKSAVSGRISIREAEVDVMHFQHLLVSMDDVEEVLTLKAFDDVDEALSRTLLHTALDESMADLTGIEQRVVRGVMQEKTLETMALEENLSRDRIRRVRNRAYRKIHKNDGLTKNRRVLRQLWEET